MNRRFPRAPAQGLLQFDKQAVWLQLPASDRDLCRELLTQILLEVMSAEGSDEDERED